ncbi:MAG: HD domain-containing protein [Chloroflexi bacterium]|nr:HD domain-containing protein [Chloroflexota bacterium]
MEAVTQAFNVIVTRGGAALRAMLGWDKDADVERARQLVRLGALLHDVGHTPFSHGPEELLPGKKKHEAFTEKIILKSEISDIIARQRTPFRLTAKEIADVALGSKWRLASDVTTRVLAELVSGDLGADRIDYLVRDSLHAGVAYGKFDYPRLIRVKSHLSHQTSFGAA